MEVIKNKTQVVAHVLKDGIFNCPVNKESGVCFGRGYAWSDTEVNAY